MKTKTLDRLRRVLAAVVVVGAVVVAAIFLGNDKKPETPPKAWAFVEPHTPAELGLTAQSGDWELEPHEGATGGRALKNHEGEAGAAPAVLVAKEPKLRDLRTTTRCKVVRTAADADSQAACGVVFRFVDANNHWIVRADTSTRSIEAVAITNGRERVLGRKEVTEGMRAGEWLELAVDARGDVVRVSLEGKPTLVAEAPTVPASFGLVGLWAPAEATVVFDHFAIETVTASPRVLEVLPLLGKRPG